MGTSRSNSNHDETSCKMMDFETGVLSFPIRQNGGLPAHDAVNWNEFI